MKKLVVRMFVISLLLLLGALFGVQQMNEKLGISQPEPLVVLKKQEGKQIESKKGNELVQKQQNELVEKKQTVEEVGRFNFFSDMGNAIADGMNYGSRAVLSQIMSFVDNVLNGEKTNAE
ncbi:hypothetical protein [Halalkalibacter lacteus]|uniref:hypothetical protein n=1 Tax=Halalkalibacter lacteus TaxID=3090663 RepID=UPI002FC71FEB